MCIDIASSGRKLYGFVYKNDANEFIYSCSQCDVEFGVGNELEQHTVGHDVKEENDIGQNSELAIDLQPIEVYPPQLSPSDSVKNEAIPLDSSTKEEMAIYLPFESSSKIEVNVIAKDTDDDDDANEPLGDDSAAFEFQNESSSSGDDDDDEHEGDFFGSASKKKSAKKSPKIRKDSKKTTYNCDICSRIFTSLARIKQHMIAGHIKKKKQTKRPPSPTLCTLCGKHIRDMKTHLKLIHSTERPFKCDFCDATFKQKVHRDTHMRQHTGEKPYVI